MTNSKLYASDFIDMYVLDEYVKVYNAEDLSYIGEVDDIESDILDSALVRYVEAEEDTLAIYIDLAK